MLKVKIIDCKIKRALKAYVFAPSIVSESTITRNMSVLEDLAIYQLGFKKKDPQFNEAFTVWWGNQKTKV